MTPRHTLNLLLEDVQLGLAGCGYDRLAESLHLKINCPLAQRDHAQNERIYAHVDHGQAYGQICVVQELAGLPRENQLGIMWHEVGHLLADMIDVTPSATELRDADRVYPDRTPEVRLEEARANAAARQFCFHRITYGPDGLQRSD